MMMVGYFGHPQRSDERLRLTYSCSGGAFWTTHTYVRAEMLLHVNHARWSANDPLEEQFVLLRHLICVAFIVYLAADNTIPTRLTVVIGGALVVVVLVCGRIIFVDRRWAGGAGGHFAWS